MADLASELRDLECAMRRKGRTSFLITVLEKDPEAIFITLDKQQADNLKREHPESRNRIFSVGELMRMRGMNLGPVIFDHRCFEAYVYRVTGAMDEMKRTVSECAERFKQSFARLGSAIHHV